MAPLGLDPALPLQTVKRGIEGTWLISRTSPESTDSLASHSNGTAVYASSAVWRLASGTSLVATVSRGFRAPNLVERYFDGPTPEGSAYQKATPDLRAETSLNADGGIKYRNDWLTSTF